MINHRDLRLLYKKFWESRGHKAVPPAPLVLSEDPTTLFTSSGMQQLVPYLTGEVHPLGKRVFDIQPCLRSQDIEEVGDNRHDTFFEMLGNWSFGDYFKKEQLPWVLEFFTKELGLDKERLYVSVFEGTKDVPKDSESEEIWLKLGIPKERIFFYGVEKNWWSRSGTPEQMPVGEIGGPDSEIFYDFGSDLKLHEESSFTDTECHPNCDCGRFIEIGNSVFIQYRKKEDKTLEELPQKNVDFGGGFERVLASVYNTPDIFATDLYQTIIHAIEEFTKQKYEDENKAHMRVIADHLKAATFLIYDGVTPSNKLQGYILRRLLRRAAVKMHFLGVNIQDMFKFSTLARSVIETYKNIYFDDSTNLSEIEKVIADELNKFSKSIVKGMNEILKIHENDITGELAFDWHQSYGFPPEITKEIIKDIFKDKNQKFDEAQFDKEVAEATAEHQQLSRTSSAGMFKGGLADQSEQTVKYHTATHLLHQALFELLGNDVRQEGSNITGERLRFDFAASRKLSDEEKDQLEKIINQKIQGALPVNFQIMPKNEASKIGAKSFFREKYPEMVKVYYVGNDLQTAYSKEFCGGPHVKNTADIGTIKIFKYEKIGNNLYRIYAQ